MILQPENEIIEYKKKLTDTLEKEVVAFLNAEGGCINIGVRDNGDIIGVPNPDKTQLQIKDRLISGISPGMHSLFSVNTELFNHKVEDKVGDKNTEKILYLMSENAKINLPEIAEKTGLSIAGIAKIIKQLKLESKISREGSRKTGQWIVEEIEKQ